MQLICSSLTLCLNRKLGEKKKEKEGEGKEGKEGEEKKRKILYCLYRKKREGKKRDFIFLLNLFSYEEILMLTK